MIVQGGGNGILYPRDVLVTDPVQFAGGDADLHLGLDHFQHFGREPAGDPHLVKLCCCLDRYTHQ